jgi:hypothetical protein
LDEASEQRDGIKGEILRQLQATGFQVGQVYVRHDGVSVPIIVRKGNRTIDRQKLILAGVDDKIVDDATVQAPDSAPYVQVRLPKQKKENYVLGQTESPAPRASRR